MSKAEELKQEAKIPDNTLLAVLSIVEVNESEVKLEKTKKYRFSESELDEYGNELIREAFKAGMSVNVRGLTEEFKDKCFNKWFKK